MTDDISAKGQFTYYLVLFLIFICIDALAEHLGKSINVTHSLSFGVVVIKDGEMHLLEDAAKLRYTSHLLENLRHVHWRVVEDSATNSIKD